MRFEAIGCVALACGLLACGTKPNDSATGGSSSGTTGGTGEASASDTSASEPTGGASEGSASATGTGGAPALPEACADACELLVQCDLSEPGTCVADCEDSLLAGCAELGAMYYACVAGLTCAELEDEENACFPLALQLDEMECFKLCTVSVGGDSGDTETDSDTGGVSCSQETRCPEEPTERVDCDESGCVCFVDGVQVKSCPEGTCSDSGVPTVDCCEGL